MEEWWKHMVFIKKFTGAIGYASYDSSKLLYDRVSIVSIDSDEFMSCSCGKIKMYVMPYRHICAIFPSKKSMYLQCFILDGTRYSIIIMVTVLEGNFLKIL